MRNIVILGAGTGRTIVANLLSSELKLKDWKITIIDRSSEHHYQPGYLFLPFKLYGYESREDIVKPIQDPLSKKVTFVQAEVTLIDHANKQIETDKGKFAYDWLVCALGCRIAPEEVEGLQQAMGRDAYTFYTLDRALEFQKVLESMKRGKLVIDTADMPIKCPTAPIEFAFLADYYFHLRGVRKQIKIYLVTPFTGAFTKPNANRVLSKIIEEKEIYVVPNFLLERVDSAHKTIHSYEGYRIRYDILCVVPPNRGPDVIEASGLGDGIGFGLTDPHTLKCRTAENIYIIGDNSNAATLKAGSVAHFQAETVVQNLLREINDEKPLPSFDGHTNCFVETGYDNAFLIDFNYDMEPLAGNYPLPVVGPFSLLKETNMNHIGKLMFKWVYLEHAAARLSAAGSPNTVPNGFCRQGPHHNPSPAPRCIPEGQRRNDQERHHGKTGNVQHRGRKAFRKIQYQRIARSRHRRQADRRGDGGRFSRHYRSSWQ